MGYTHYWNRPQEFDPAIFRLWVADVERILTSLPPHSTSAGGYYAEAPLLIGGRSNAIWTPERPGVQLGTILVDDHPIVTPDQVIFNGRGLDSDGGDLSHETFVVERVIEPGAWQRANERGWFFEFCKTSRKPYDLAVVAALVRLGYHFPEGIEITSDGNTDDWADGLDLCRRLFGFAFVPLSAR